MKTIRLFLLLLLCLFSVNVTAEMAAQGAMPYMGPPAANPHPPVTELDKKRVAFAELAIQSLLMTPLPADDPKKPATVDFYSPLNSHFDLDETCLKDPTCLEKNEVLIAYVKAIKRQHLHLKEIRFTHIIPWSMEKYLKNKSATTTPAISQGDPGKSMKASMTVMPSAPAQKDDEYMFHTYAQNGDGVWYHVDVFVTEDAKGQLKFRHFYLTPMAPAGGGHLPDGVVC